MFRESGGGTGKYNIIQNTYPTEGKLSVIHEITPWEVNPTPWHTMPLTLYHQECSNALHEIYPAIVVSDIVLPTWLELPLFTVIINGSQSHS